MPNISIRKMIKNDTSQILEILNKWNMAPSEPSKENPDPERTSLLIENTFVAVDGEKIVGVCSYIVLSEELAETASLAVNPDYRGTGLGFLLQKARLQEMTERGIKIVRTETDRPATIAWYIRKFGYRLIGKNPKKHNFSLADVDHWTILELNLDDYEI